MPTAVVTFKNGDTCTSILNKNNSATYKYKVYFKTRIIEQEDNTFNKPKIYL